MNVEIFLYLLVNIHQFIHGMASVNCWNWDWLALSWRFVYLFTFGCSTVHMYDFGLAPQKKHWDSGKVHPFKDELIK